MTFYYIIHPADKTPNDVDELIAYTISQLKNMDITQLPDPPSLNEILKYKLSGYITFKCEQPIEDLFVKHNLHLLIQERKRFMIQRHHFLKDIKRY